MEREWRINSQANTCESISEFKTKEAWEEHKNYMWKENKPATSFNCNPERFPCLAIKTIGESTEYFSQRDWHYYIFFYDYEEI